MSLLSNDEHLFIVLYIIILLSQIESLYSTVSFYAYPCLSSEDMKKGNCKGVGQKMGGEPGNYKAYVSFLIQYFNNNNIYSITSIFFA